MTCVCGNEINTLAVEGTCSTCGRRWVRQWDEVAKEYEAARLKSNSAKGSPKKDRGSGGADDIRRFEAWDEPAKGKTS